MEFTGKQAGIPGALRTVSQSAVLGNKPTMESMMDNVRTGMQPAIEGMQKSASPPTWAEEFKRNRELTETLVKQGKTSLEELRKAFGGKTSTVLFSR